MIFFFNGVRPLLACGTEKASGVPPIFQGVYLLHMRVEVRRGVHHRDRLGRVGGSDRTRHRHEDKKDGDGRPKEKTNCPNMEIIRLNGRSRRSPMVRSGTSRTAPACATHAFPYACWPIAC